MLFNFWFAGVAELVDAHDSKSCIRKDVPVRVRPSVQIRGDFISPFYFTSMDNSENKYFVYAINSLIRNYIYVGLTGNLHRRISNHNRGYNRTTKPYLPFKLIYSEEFNSRKEARVKEKYLKSGISKKFLRTFIK